MSCFIKRALPFALTFVLGLALAALLGTWHSRGLKHYYRASTVLMPMNDDVPYERGWMKRRCHRDEGAWSIPEQRAWSGPSVGQSSSMAGDSTPVRVISYSNVSTPDGEPVTRDAVITDLPTPRFWTLSTEHEQRFAPFAYMLRVTLNASGKVGEIETVYGSSTEVLGVDTFVPAHRDEDIMAAARGIQFRPAMRGSTPVSQQVTILYRQE